MTETIHESLLETSSPWPGLHAALKNNGPLVFHATRNGPVAIRLCRSVADQQLSIKAAGTIWGRVEDAAKQAKDKHFLDFVATTPPETLRGCGLSRSKVRTIQGIAEAFLSGRLSEASLQQLSSKDRKDRLTQLWGVGPWTVDMINMFYYGDPDIWPKQDITVIKTFENLVGLDTEDARETCVAGFAPHRSTLALHMWQVKDRSPNVS